VTTSIVIDCDPGHAMRSRSCRGSGAIVGAARITTVAGNHSLDKTTRNALKCRAPPARYSSPPARTVRRARAAHRRERARRERARRAGSARSRRRKPVAGKRRTSSRSGSSRASCSSRPDRSRTSALLSSGHPSEGTPRAIVWNGGCDRGGERDAGSGVQRVRRSRGSGRRVRSGIPGGRDRARHQPTRRCRFRGTPSRCAARAAAGRAVAELAGLLPRIHRRRYPSTVRRFTMRWRRARGSTRRSSRC